jgi:SPP1 family predicted phage head-tail adaptor
VRAGELRHRIAIESFAVTKNAFGEDVRAYAVNVRAWAKIETLLGRELQIAQAIVQAVTHKITIRYQDGIDSTQRIRFGQRYFGVGAAIDPDQRKVKLELYCTEESGS